MGGDPQAAQHKDDARSHYPPLSQLCENTGLDHITPKDMYPFTLAKTHIDHWFLRQSHTPHHYTIHDANITTCIPEYRDHKALILDLPQISDIQQQDAKHTHSNLTTRSHPSFILPIPASLVELYQLGNTPTKANTQHITQTTTALLHDNNATTDQIDYAVVQVMAIIHEYHDIATTI